MTKRPGGRTKWLAVVLVTALCTALAVMTFGAPDMKRPGVADAAEVGTTVGSAQYPVPAGAVVVSPSGDDNAAGTAAAPYRTLTKAASAAAAGQTIVLRAGTYHESVAVYKRVTIQSWPGETVWLDGSVPVNNFTASGGRWKTGWSLHLDASPTYTRGAPDNTTAAWSFVSASYPMASHPDQLWIDNVAQRQVGSLGEVAAGTFFHDEGANQLWLGTDPSGKNVRASDLIRALMIRADGSSVRGIGIRRYAPSVPDMGAVTLERAGILIENVAITDSATTGLHVGSSNNSSGNTVRNVRIERSGMLGMNATYADNLTVDQLVSVNNNTEHFNTSPVSGGVKITRTRGVVVRNSVLNDNYGPGLWFDESVYDMAVTGNEMRNNAKHGLSLEISAKATVTNNTISGNDGFGIKVNDTSNVTISNNTFVGNDRSINIVQDARTPATDPGRDPRQPVPDPTMTWKNGPATVTNNVMSNQQSGNCLLCVEDYTHTRSAEQMGITANGNVYGRPNTSTPANVTVWSTGAGNPATFGSVTSFHAATGQEASGSEVIGTPTTTPTTKAPAPTTTTTKAPAPTTTTTKAPAPTTTTTKAPTTPTTLPDVPEQYVSDAFGRIQANGFGNADVGGAYTVSEPNTGYAVAYGIGRIAGATGHNRSAYLPDVNQRDIDFLTDLTLDLKPSGGGAYVSLIGRRVASGTDYRLKLRYMPDGTIVAYLVRTVGGTEKIIAWKNVPGINVDPFDTVRVRFVVSGGATTTLRVAIWSKDSAGPVSWLISTTDSAPKALQSAGDIGFLLYTSKAWVGRAPSLVIDNVAVREY
jgi:parallel beta-helix repeat protein